MKDELEFSTGPKLGVVWIGGARWWGGMLACRKAWGLTRGGVLRRFQAVITMEADASVGTVRRWSWIMGTLLLHLLCVSLSSHFA